jgi:hypothetical protein
MFNPTLFDTWLTRLENQLQSWLNRVTHAIQSAMYQKVCHRLPEPSRVANALSEAGS